MDLFSKPIAEIDSSDIEVLVANGPAEGALVEYKSDLPVVLGTRSSGDT